MTTEPTDAELKAMWQLHAADIGGIFYYARAVLAKWGQPVVAAAPDERADFERWQTDVLCRSLDALTQGAECPGEYDDMDVHHEWTAWQARAVLAKWGTPAPVGVEPVARLEIGKTKGGVSLTHIAEPAAFQLPEGMYALYTAPQPTQTQAVPLTDEQIHAIYDEVARREPYAGAVTRRNIVRAIEAAHGIKGGQHGTE